MDKETPQQRLLGILLIQQSLHTMYRQIKNSLYLNQCEADGGWSLSVLSSINFLAFVIFTL